MKKIQLLIFITILFIISACGTNIQENKHEETYDMWYYMTPPHSIDVEYIGYIDGTKTDELHETTKVYDNYVERESSDELTTLTPYDNHIRIEESNGNTITVQRYVKIGDTNIFNSTASPQSCTAEDYFRSTIIKGYEFFNVIKVICISDSYTSEIYYGYDEGIVAINRIEQESRTDMVKSYERRLQ